MEAEGLHLTARLHQIYLSTSFLWKIR